jgi:hypothetical protein
MCSLSLASEEIFMLKELKYTSLVSTMSGYESCGRDSIPGKNKDIPVDHCVQTGCGTLQ